MNWAAMLLAVMASGPGAPAPEEMDATRRLRESLAAMRERNRDGLSPNQRAMLEDQRVFEHPLDRGEIERAERALRAADRRGRERSRLRGSCSPETLPLDIRFADYTVGADGQPIPGSTGWTPEERTRFSNFLCQMLPIVQKIYAPPFSRWTITLVKDLRYTESWIFFPSTLEIHSDGSWNARLLTHEFIHAFRGRRTLTSDQNWNYLTTLSGFEEGFAEGVAYLAMNEYVARYCVGGQCPPEVPSGTFWYSYLEWTYDYSNDESLATEDFWSDSGGTLKYHERYLMAAAAVMRLETAVPGFSRRFNQEYYARIQADPAYRPTRDAVIAVIESLTRGIDALAVREWITQQRIFDCRRVVGKKDWTTNYTPYFGIEYDTMTALYFVETFPGGSEWAQYVPNCPLVIDPTHLGGYLYYRLHQTAGNLALSPAWNSAPPALFGVTMQNDPDSTSRVSGCNDVLGSFGAAELHLVGDLADCVALWVPTPTCILKPDAFGLYRTDTSWLNPQFQLPSGPPHYAMPYDVWQRGVATSRPVLTGRVPADFDPQRHVFVGGIVGANSGTLAITHSTEPGRVEVAVRNGAFYAEVPTCSVAPPPSGVGCWVRPYASWSSALVTTPGTLTFTFTPEVGRPWTETRTIVFGNEFWGGRHKFLLGTEDLIFRDGFESPAAGPS